MIGAVIILSTDSQKKVAADLATELKRSGFQTWDCENDLLPGDEWDLEIPNQITKASAAVVLIPAKSVTDWLLKDGLVRLSSLGKPTKRVVIGQSRVLSQQTIDEIATWLHSLD